MKRIINPDNNMWRSTDPPQWTECVAARIGGGGLKVIEQEHRLSDKSESVFKQKLYEGGRDTIQYYRYMEAAKKYATCQERQK